MSPTLEGGPIRTVHADGSAGAHRGTVLSLAGFVVALAALALLGKLAGVGWLESLHASAGTMKTNAALGLIVAAATLAVLVSRSRRRLYLLWPLSAVLALLGAATLAQDFLNTDLGIDELLLRETKWRDTGWPGRMAPGSALGLVLIGVSIVMLDRKRFMTSQACAAGAGALALLALIGHSFGVPGLYRIGFYTAMAINSALAILALCSALILLQRRSGFLTYNRQRSGRLVTSYFLATASAVTYALGFVISGLVSADPYSGTFAIALFTICILVLLIGITLWCGRRLAAAEEEKELLVRELNHRVKNILTVAIALIRQSGRDLPDSAQRFADEIAARLGSLSNIHAILLDKDWSSAELHEILETELAPFRAESGRITFRGPRVKLKSYDAVNLGLIIHELTTNAVKYGSLSATEGKLDVDWSVGPETGGKKLALTWKERGGPPVTPPEQTGFGGELMSRLLPQANVARAFEPEGVTMKLELALE